MIEAVGELCVLTPVARGREEELGAELARLPSGRRSPFAGVEGTHYARFVVVPHLEDRRGRPLESTACLLFACEFDGLRDRYLEALCVRMAPEAHRIWSHCAGYPDVEDAAGLRRYLLDHRVEPVYSVVARPEASLARIRASLGARERLAAFARESQGLDAVALKRHWDDAFPTGG